MGFCFSCRGVRPKKIWDMGRRAAFLAAVVAGILFSTQVFASNDKAALQPLAEAVAAGIRTHPDHDLVVSRKNAAGEELLQAKAQYLPTVNLQLEGGRSTTSSPFASSTGTYNNGRGSLTLSQLLFDGSGTSKEIERRKYLTESAGIRVRHLEQFLGLEIVEAYLEVMRQRSLLLIGNANVEKHALLLGKIEAGARAGTLNQGDVAQAQARLNSARAQSADLENNLRAAEALFAQKTGNMPGHLMMPDIPRGQIPMTADGAVAEALVGSTTLEIFGAEIKASKAAYESASSAFYPQVTFEASGNDSVNGSGTAGNQNSASALVVAKWNLWRGGADAARKRQLLNNYAETESSRMSAVRQLENDVRKSFADMQAAKKRTQEFLEQVKANKKVVRAYLDQFSLHRRSLLDVLDAQSELFRSRLDLVSAVYTENFAAFRLLTLQGKLLDVLGVDVASGAQSEKKS